MIIHVHVLFVCEVPKGTCWGSANSVPVVIMLVGGPQLVWSHSLAKPTSEIDPQMSVPYALYPEVFPIDQIHRSFRH